MYCSVLYPLRGPLLSDTRILSFLSCSCRLSATRIIILSSFGFSVRGPLRGRGLSPFRSVDCKDYFFVFFWVPLRLYLTGAVGPTKTLFFGFYLVFGLCTVMKQRLVFRVLVGLVRICTANSRVLLYGV